MNPGDPTAREWFQSRVRDVHRNPNGGGGDDYFFFRQGEDLVVTKPDGKFVSMFPDQGNGWFKDAEVFH